MSLVELKLAKALNSSLPTEKKGSLAAQQFTQTQSSFVDECLNGFGISHFFEVLSRLNTSWSSSQTAKNCDLHFTFDEDVDRLLNFFI